MKLSIAFLSLVFAVGFSACTTAPIASREVTLIPCCASLEPAKNVILQDSFAPDGRVVRLVSQSTSAAE